MIIAAQNGEPTAFETLTKENLPLIYRYLFRLVGNEAAAEDMAQETFVRVWKNLSRFDTSKPFRPCTTATSVQTAPANFGQGQERPNN